MLIWIAAFVLLGLGAAAGYVQGAIRAAASLLGLFMAVLLAKPLSPMLKPIVAMAVKNHPILLQIIPGVVVFLVVLIVFKIIGNAVHHKITVGFKYEKDDMPMIRFARLNSRLGLCVGLMNGSVYLLALLVPIYALGYLTAQVASPNGDPLSIRLLTRARTEMHALKLDKVVAAYDPAPAAYYESADILGLIKQNPLVVSRLTRYPAFLTLAERPELQEIANDVTFQEMIQRQASVGEYMANEKAQSLARNQDLANEVKTALGNDLRDLRAYLETGRSEKYGDIRILGRWEFDLNGSLLALKRKKANISGLEIRRTRARMVEKSNGAILVATVDNKVFWKGDINKDENGVQMGLITEGTWEKNGGSYGLKLNNQGKEETIEVDFDENDRLLITRDGLTLVFDKEL